MVDPTGHGDLRLLEGYSGARCLVTGHTGFKGAWLCQWLHRLGAKVTGYALDPPSEPSLFDLAGVGSLVDDVRGDLLDREALSEAMLRCKPQVVFHLAAQALVRRSYAEPRYTFDVNVGGTVNVLEILRSCPSLKAVVVVTSDKCHENRGRPDPFAEDDPLGGSDPYSASKACAEIVSAAYRCSFLEQAGIGLATARAGNVVGGGDWAEDRIIPDAVRALERGEPVPVRNPGHVRPWQHVLEPLFGYLVLGAGLLGVDRDRAELRHQAGAWNFGPHAESCRTVQEVVETFLASHGRGTWADLSGAPAPREAQFLSLAWDKARQGLGWRPRWNFQQTMDRTARWYRKQQDGGDARELCQMDIKAYDESKT